MKVKEGWETAAQSDRPQEASVKAARKAASVKLALLASPDTDGRIVVIHYDCCEQPPFRIPDTLPGSGSMPSAALTGF